MFITVIDCQPSLRSKITKKGQVKFSKNLKLNEYFSQGFSTFLT